MNNEVDKLEIKDDENETPVDDNKDGYDMSPVTIGDTPTSTGNDESNEIEIDVDIEQQA